MANPALPQGRIATAAAHDQQAHGQASGHLAAWYKTRCQGRNRALQVQSAHVLRVNQVHSAAVGRAATLGQTRVNAVIALPVLPRQREPTQQVRRVSAISATASAKASGANG